MGESKGNVSPSNFEDENLGSIFANRRVTTWKNMSMDNIRLGIAREKVNLQIHEDLIGKIELQKLIDLAMLIMSDFRKEKFFDVLNNAKNS